jgi:DNA-binding NarL/FixJ family response regulator
MSAKLPVFLVDDHALLREGLRALIDVQPDLCVVGEASDGLAAIRAVADAQPRVVVMDISMPNCGGVEATQQIHISCPSVRILALTAHESSDYVQLLLRAGASGYLLKRAAASDLIRAIRAVAAGHLYLDTTFSDGLAEATPRAPSDKPPSHALSERETEVLRMIALGYSMKRIAADLELSPRTLETYKKRGMAKLEFTSRADIVRYALQQGWLEDG